MRGLNVIGAISVILLLANGISAFANSSGPDPEGLEMPELILLLESPDPEKRRTAVRRLGGVKGRVEEATTFLLPVLRDEAEEPDIRAEAALSLGRLGDSRATTLLTRLAISSRESRVRQAAAEGLPLTGDSGIEALRIALVTESHDSDRLHFALLLLGSFEQRASPAVGEMSHILQHHELPYLKLSAASALERVGTPEAREALLAVEDELMPFLENGLERKGGRFYKTAQGILRFMDSPRSRSALEGQSLTRGGQKERELADTL